jgi:capsular exopolysaccharide synthesis family protein
MEATLGASDWLVGQVDELQGKLEKSEVALQRFKEGHDILSASFEDRQSMNSNELFALSKALTDLRLRKMEVEVRHQQVEKALEGGAQGTTGLRALPLVHNSPAVNTRWSALQELKTERAELMSKYGPLHPKLQSMERQIAAEEEELDKEVRLIIEVEQRSHEELVEVEKVYVAALERAKTQAFNVNRNEVEYNRLKRDMVNNERLYEMVLRRQKEADLSRALKFNNMRVLDRAEAPTTPIRPNNTRNVLFGLMVGLMLGIALAFLLEFLDNTVKNQEDIEGKLGITFLGILPTIKQKSMVDAKGARDPERDLHVHRFPKSPAAECCRAVRTNLLFMGGDTPLHTLLVTSPSPTDGKTTAAVSLAITLAQSGGQTLIVDTDLRRPRLHKSFQLTNEVGLTNVLLGDVALKDAVQTTEVPGLLVLTCGPVPPNPAELLHTGRFREVLANVREQFDRVVLDSPPVSAVADPLILSSYVDGVVLAIRCLKTTRESVARTRRALMDVNARILGALLNDIDLERRDGYYAYYPARYGYVYGDGEKEATTEKKAEAA